MSALPTAPASSSVAKRGHRLPHIATAALSLLWLLIAGGEAMAAGANVQISEAPAYAPIVKAATFGCTLSHGQLVCGVVNGDKNTNEQDGQLQGQSPCPPSGATGLVKHKTACQQGGSPINNAGSQDEHSCPPGYVVLDKPNKYGAFCEPKEGFPEQTQ